MTSYVSRNYIVSDGVTATVAVPFPYVAKANVQVTVNGAAYGGVVTWVSPSQISLSPIPAAGVNVGVVRRTVSTAILAQIQAGTVNPGDLNLDDTQLLYLVQEGVDDGLDTSSRALLVPEFDIGQGLMVIPPASQRGGKVMSFDPTTKLPTVSDPMVVQAQAAAVAAQGFATQASQYAQNAVSPATFAARFIPPHVLGTSDQISVAITGQAPWIGNYTIGTEKDYICLQETLYACAAGASTPGNVVWNVLGAGRGLNQRGFIPVASYQINRGLLLVGSGLHIEVASRLATVFNWTGDATTPMIFTDAVAYTVFEGITMSAQAPMDTMWEMDWDGTYNTLRTQQLTLYDIVLQGNFMAKRGIRISHSGGGAQGDTILFVNPIGTAFLESAVSLEGGNALDVNFLLGDFQNCGQDAIRVTNGAVRTWGTHMENQGLETLFSFEPCYNQIVNDGADVHIYGAPTGNASAVRSMRSEGVIPVVCEGGAPVRVDDISALGADATNFRGFMYGKGAIIGGTGVGTKYKTFIVVETGNPILTDWQTPTAKNGLVYSFTGTPFTPGALVGEGFVYRYNSGTTLHSLITANTNSTVTIDTEPGALNAGNLTRIGGLSANVIPDYDTCPQGYSVQRGAVGQGFSTTAASTTISFGSDIASKIAANMYVVIPRAATVNPGVAGSRDWTCALIAKVTAYAGGGATTATIDRPAAFTVTNGNGFYGSPLADGGIKVIEADFDAIVGVGAGDGIDIRYGRTRSCQDLTNVQSFRTPNDLFSRPDNSKGVSFSLASSPRLLTLAAPVNTSGATDLTNPMVGGDTYSLTVNGPITFNASVPIPGVEQTFTLRLVSNSTNVYKVDWGPNITAPCPYYSTPINGAEQCIVFKSRGTKWVEYYRAPQSFPYTPTVLGSSTAGTPDYSGGFQHGVCDLNGRAGRLTFAVRAATGLGGAAGNILFGGTPVPFSNAAEDRLSGFVTRAQNITFGAGLTQAGLDDNQDQATIQLVASGTGVSYSQVAVAGWGALGIIGGVVEFRLPSA